MKTSIKKTKRTHPGYSPEANKLVGEEIIAKDQFIYESSKGAISLIPPSKATFNTWEAFGIGDKDLGDISENPQRFGTQEEAEEFINDVL